MNKLFTYLIIGKKKYDTRNQCTSLFSDQRTVSDEALGRFTIERYERCWNNWLKECKEELNKNDCSDNNSDKKND